MKAGTAVGKKRNAYDAGSWSRIVILWLIKTELAKPEAQPGAIFDGFPRTAAQAELVDKTLGLKGQRLNHVLLLDVPEEELVQRLHARAQQEGRADDTPETIRTRLAVYHQETAPLMAYYAQRGNVHRVPGVGTIDDIVLEIRRLLGQ
jgi:adenylate kinase